MENEWERLYKKWGRKRRRKLIFLIPILLALIGIFFYFFVLPFLIKKPFIPRPIYEGNLTVEHINWIANELGAYKLHSYTGEKPEVEIDVIDTDQFFTVIIDDIPKTYSGKAKNPDIRIVTKKAYIGILFETDDLIKGAIRLYKEGKVKMEILKDEAILISKGYKALYDEFEPFLRADR